MSERCPHMLSEGHQCELEAGHAANEAHIWNAPIEPTFTQSDLDRARSEGAKDAYLRVAEWLDAGQGSKEIVALLRSNAKVMRIWAKAEADRKAKEG